MARLPNPHNPEAEQGVIGSILIDNAALVEIATLIEPADFHDTRLRMIYQAALGLQSRQVPVDMVMLMTALKDAGQLADAGGASYLAELIDYVPTAAHAGHYARIVRKAAIRRRLIEAARNIAGMAADTEQDDDTLLPAAMARLEAIGTGAVGAERDLLTLVEMAAQYEQHVKAYAKSRFVTGLPPLDEVIRGVAPGEVMMVTAYSGLFKSALLQNMLLEACRRTELSHVFYSLEMPATRVFERTVQIGTETLTYQIESDFMLRPACRDRALADLAARHADKLIVCDRAAMTIEQIEHYTRLARSRYGQIGAIGIDYLGLMGAEGSKSEYERISHVAENSKHLAKRLNVPVIILTQISRAAAMSGDIGMHSAKGSGAVEASADYMLCLMKNERKELILRLAKNRNGDANIDFLVDLDAKYLKFRGLLPADSIAAKEVRRGEKRVRKSFQEGPVDYDPYA